MMRHHSQTGFTLIELIIVIVITGIIAAVVSPIVSNQFRAYSDSSRRATLVQEAQSVMQQLERDLYYAVPNSTLASEDDNEFYLLVLARSTDSEKLPSGRYDDSQFGDGSFDADEEWNVFGCLITDGDNLRIVVGSRVPEETLDSYDDDIPPPPGSNESNPVSPATATLEFIENTPCGEDNAPEYTVTLDESHDFQGSSSYNRLYLTQGKVTYRCTDEGLSREQDFGSSAGDANPVSDLVGSCEFDEIVGGTYSPPSLLVSITLGAVGSEQITLIRSFQLVNAP